MPNRIDPMDLMSLLIINKVTPLLLTIRKDLQQNQRPHLGVQDLSIIESLIGVIYRLGINPFSRRGIVFDLDRKISSHGFDENSVIDRDMRVLSSPLHITVSPLPLELLLRRVFKLVIKTIPEILQFTIISAKELKGLKIIRSFPNLHLAVKIGANDHEFRKDRLFVILIEIGKILSELIVSDDFCKRDSVKDMLLRIILVSSKDILRIGRLLETKLNIVTEKETILSN